MKPSSRTKIVRSPKRAHYDRKTLYEVLDDGFICHVAYTFEGAPIIIPTAYAREGDVIYIHGAMRNRMMNSLLEQKHATLAVTHLDGLVLARSVFNHSFNYRSAVIFGQPFIVEDPVEKNRILELITENIIAGRWSEARLPTEHELAVTLVIGIKIVEASVKIRAGKPVDDEDDYGLAVWAGELPLTTNYSQAIADESGVKGLNLPKSVKILLKN